MDKYYFAGMNTAFATSLFAEKNYDEFLTINFAEEKGISAVQFYMNAGLQRNKNKIRKIRDLCREKSIGILCHSPKSIGLEEVSADSAHCEALSSIFYEGAVKYCVFHFYENCEIEAAISDCEKLIALGITPCIENVYRKKTSIGLFVNTSKYLEFFNIVSKRNLPILPVFDFPRIFIERFKNFQPIRWLEFIIQNIGVKKIIIHAIDSVSLCQKRSDWCALGQGIVEWNKIFDFIKRENIFVEYTVLEYENTDFIDESIKYLESKNI